MRADIFPDCCAGVIFSRFGNTTTAAGGNTPYTKEEVTQWLNEVEPMWKHRGFAMIVLNKTQANKIGKAVTDNKYECIAENIYHPGHRSRINIYLKRFHKT